MSSSSAGAPASSQPLPSWPLAWLAVALRQAVAGGVPDDVVVGEDPGGGCAGFGGLGEVPGDDFAEFVGVEVGLQEVEVEGLTQSLRAGVAGPAAGVHPGFGDGGARRVVLVEDLAPFGVDLVDFVAVPERVRAVREPVRAGVRLAQFRLGDAAAR